MKPTQNRITDGERTVQLEPKMVDVLVLLARRSGDVVSKAEIEDSVWSDVIVTESVITRAIAGLRKALGDDSSRPRFIETIPRRGYRLMTPPVLLEGVAPEPEGRRRLAPAVGRWVRGAAFVGRARVLEEILDGPRHALWVIGGRSVGRTSLLRQLELLAGDPARPELPLFWDLQGVASADDVAESLAEALLDAGDRLEAAGVSGDTVAAGDPPSRLAALRRALTRAGRRLLLLLDEAEALIAVAAADPSLLARLRRVLQGHQDLRSVLAATPLLWELARPTGPTSPFLHGFVPPLPLGRLEDDEATALLEGVLGEVAGAREVAEITCACGNHPALLQLAAAHLQERGEVTAALARVASDPWVTRLFELDWQLCSAGEREAMTRLAAGEPVPSEAEGAIHALEALGVLRRGPDGPVLGGALLASWVRSRRP